MALWFLRKPTIWSGEIAAAVLVSIVPTRTRMCQSQNAIQMEEQLDPLAEQIISLLVFEETFEQMVSELPQFSQYAIADELKNLIVKDYARPYRDIETDTTSGILYDSDQLKAYSFTLTAKGITYLENNLKLK